MNNTIDHNDLFSNLRLSFEYYTCIKVNFYKIDYLFVVIKNKLQLLPINCGDHISPI